MDLQPTRTPAHSWGWHARRTTSERYKRERRAETSDSIRTGETDMDGGGRVSALSPPLGHQPWVASPAVRRTEEKARTRGGEGRPSASATRPCPARRRRGGSRPCLGVERERERERERDGLGNLDGRVDVKETQGERASGKNASWSINTPFVLKYNNFLAHKIYPKIYQFIH